MSTRGTQPPCSLGRHAGSLKAPVCSPIHSGTLTLTCGARHSSQLDKGVEDALGAYRKFCAQGANPGQLILPEALKLLPLYTLALAKLPCFQCAHPCTLLPVDARLGGARSSIRIADLGLLLALWRCWPRLDAKWASIRARSFS